MEQLPANTVALLLATLVAAGSWLWTQVRPSHRVRRAMQRADARARSLHRH
jgi:hypothetical protein